MDGYIVTGAGIEQHTDSDTWGLLCVRTDRKANLYALTDSYPAISD